MKEHLEIKKELREIAIAGDASYTVAANVIAELVEQINLGTKVEEITVVLDDIAKKFKERSTVEQAYLYAQLVAVIEKIKGTDGGKTTG